MHVENLLSPEFEALANADIFNHGYLPIAAAYCRRLGLVELVDRMVETQMEVRPGLVVQAMVLDVLSGRTPLYRLEHFLAAHGSGTPPDSHSATVSNAASRLSSPVERPVRYVLVLGL
jgi:hypothetical protein